MPRIEPRIFILFLILGIVPLVVGSLVLLYEMQETYQEVVGRHLSDQADQGQLALSHYLQRMILQVAGLTVVPEVRAVTETGENPGGRELQAQIERLEQEWPQLNLENSPALRRILENPASEFLRQYQRISPMFREILVTDRIGRLVAATNKTSDYFQADERWWHYSFREGVGGHFLSDLQYDESARAYAFEIAQPVMTQGQVSGILKVTIDAQELFSLVNSIAMGRDGQALLVRGDGTILIGPEASIEDAQTYRFADALQALAAGNRLFGEAGEGDEEVLLGLSPSRLQHTYPELDWYVVVEAAREQVFASFRQAFSLYLSIVVFIVLSVGALSLVFSWLLSRPVIETDPHLEKL